MERGFTLIELILVTSLMILLGTLTTAFGARFFTQNAIDNATDQLLGDIRQAQINAMMGKKNGNWGVDYASNKITLYFGTSFAGRTTALDTTFSVPVSVSITGFSDLNFTRMRGIPNATPIITISGSGETNTITVNSQGVATR